MGLNMNLKRLIPSTYARAQWGYFVTDEDTCATTREGIFAGGDIVRGAATVISALGDGKRAAKATDNYLS
jgi:glutamate synthase (NADPH/NADH) small chain